MHQKAPNQTKVLINIVCVTLEGLWIISDIIVNFRFFVKFHRSGAAVLNYNRACSLCIKKDPNQGKDLMNMVSVTLEVLWMISDRIVNFRFFCQVSQVWTCKNY